MRKIFLILALIALISTATATTIAKEDVTIDLADNHVQAEVHVDKLTSSSFTYISTVNVQGLNATLDGEPVNCQVSDLTLGSEVQCDTDKRENFTVTLNYRAEDFVSNKDDVKIFRYRQPIYRPTNNYSLEVILPRGAALVDQENTSQQVISPQSFETGSNGQRIFVTWDIRPRLGETLSFFILYEDLAGDRETRGEGFLVEIIIVILVLFVSAAAVIRHKRRDLSDKYDELSKDQKEVLDRIEENEGEYLQKDLVQELDYSKAKVSGIVSELVDKGILKKTKEGRSNKLSISRKYRY